MTDDAVAFMLTAFFVFGCITIYKARQHARAMTPTLVLVAVCLGIFASVVATTKNTGGVQRALLPRQTVQRPH